MHYSAYGQSSHDAMSKYICKIASFFNIYINFNQKMVCNKSEWLFVHLNQMFVWWSIKISKINTTICSFWIRRKIMTSKNDVQILAQHTQEKRNFNCKWWWTRHFLFGFLFSYFLNSNFSLHYTKCHNLTFCHDK